MILSSIVIDSCLWNVLKIINSSKLEKIFIKLTKMFLCHS